MRLVVVIGGLGLLVVAIAGAGGYGLWSAKASVESVDADAERFLGSMGSDTTLVDDAFAIPDWSPGIDSTIPQVTQTVNAFLVHVGEATKNLSTDQRRLESIAGRLQAQYGNVLTVPFRERLDKSKVRVDSLLTAMTAAGKGLQVVRDELRLMSSFLDWAATVLRIGEFLNTNDLSGATTAFSDLNVNAQTVAQAAQRYNGAPEVAQLVSAVSSYDTDLQAGVRAAVARDQARLTAATQNLQADGRTLDAINGAAIDAYYQTKIKPQRDLYVAAAAKAGIQAHPRLPSGT